MRRGYLSGMPGNAERGTEGDGELPAAASGSVSIHAMLASLSRVVLVAEAILQLRVCGCRFVFAQRCRNNPLVC